MYLNGVVIVLVYHNDNRIHNSTPTLQQTPSHSYQFLFTAQKESIRTSVFHHLRIVNDERSGVGTNHILLLIHVICRSIPDR